MPDALEWLVEYADSGGETRYEHIETRDDAIEYLRQLFAQGQAATLYQRVPFEVQIGVTVKSPRRRRKKEAKDSTDALGKGHTPADDGGASAGGPVLQTGPDGCQSTEENRAIESGDASDGEKDGAPKPESAPIPLWDCEARFDGDPACPGPTAWDSVTGGVFCGLHALIPESNRRELHRKHKHRNRPVRVAHAG